MNDKALAVTPIYEFIGTIGPSDEEREDMQDISKMLVDYCNHPQEAKETPMEFFNNILEDIKEFIDDFNADEYFDYDDRLYIWLDYYRMIEIKEYLQITKIAESMGKSGSFIVSNCFSPQELYIIKTLEKLEKIDKLDSILIVSIIFFRKNSPFTVAYMPGNSK